MKNIKEYIELKNYLKNQYKSKQQINTLFGADCEIVKVAKNQYFTTSIDSLGEEILFGLYKNVETWAWITVMSSVSDLAVSGSTPLGLTLSTQWKIGTGVDIKSQFFKGVHVACKKAKVPLLGGDSGQGASHIFTSSIMGMSKKPPLMRVGAKETDLLVLCHHKDVGIGPTLGISFLKGVSDLSHLENIFRPTPSWELTQLLATYATAAIDTSDGIATSIAILNDLNNLSADLYWNDKITSPHAIKALQQLKLSPVLSWLGDHGDFHSLLVIPKKNISKIPKSQNVTIIGEFKARKNQTRIQKEGKWFNLPIEQITSCPRDLVSLNSLLDEFNSRLIL